MEEKILIKVHKSYRLVVAICDANLKGEKFEDGDHQLDLTSSFFDGENFSYDELKSIVEDAVREDATFYIVGESSINFVKEIGIVDSNGVGMISNVPFALVLL